MAYIVRFKIYIFQLIYLRVIFTTKLLTIQAQINMPHQQFINREISWLAFNARVLQEAANVEVPLLERLKFLGIFSSNLDEFFRVRVASLKRMVDVNATGSEILGGKPKKILQQIQEIVLEQRHSFDKIYSKIEAELKENGIHIIDESELSVDQGQFVRNYFQSKVRPRLVPIMLDNARVFPNLKDKSVYLTINLHDGNAPGARKPKMALMELPTDTVPRFIVLPHSDDDLNTYIILLDDLLRYNLREIFAIFRYKYIEAYTIKATRDAELDVEEEYGDTYIQKVTKSLKQRKRGRLVRFIYDEKMPPEMLRFLIRKLKLRGQDNPIPGARYHNFKDFMKFPDVGPDSWRYPSAPSIPHPDIQPNASMLQLIHDRDLLLHYPYQNFSYLIDLLRESAIDPQVESIKMTLYRVAPNSNVINALINAVKNGKQVMVVVELQARFDEEANIFWADQLREEGAKVMFGVPGLKVHSKLCLIQRKDRSTIHRYAYIGTGNFNETTSRLYGDHGLFTAHKGITQEVNNIFNFFESNFKPGTYKHLLVSPFHMRSEITALINNEIANAQAGRTAYMVLKMNSLVDEELIVKLYEAGKAGVEIKLIVRGICSIIPGQLGLSTNIEAISIVDRYLEHTRVYLFANGGEEKLYIGSSDLMTRNLDRRVEVVAPIYDPKLFSQIKAFLAVQLLDNVKSRNLDLDNYNKLRVRPEGEEKLQAQTYFYDLIKQSMIEGNSVFEDIKLPLKSLEKHNSNGSEIKKKRNVKKVNAPTSDVIESAELD